jgi:hypothetical protein
MSGTRCVLTGKIPWPLPVTITSLIAPTAARTKIPDLVSDRFYRFQPVPLIGYVPSGACEPIEGSPVTDKGGLTMKIVVIGGTSLIGSKTVAILSRYANPV